MSWGCGSSRSLMPGDRVFVHRVAQEPKGVFASGYVTRAPYEVPDASRKARLSAVHRLRV